MWYIVALQALFMSLHALVSWWLWSYNRTMQEWLRAAAMPDDLVRHLIRQDSTMSAFSARQKLLKAVTFLSEYLVVLAFLNVVCFALLIWVLTKK